MIRKPNYDTIRAFKQSKLLCNRLQNKNYWSESIAITVANSQEETEILEWNSNGVSGRLNLRWETPWWETDLQWETAFLWQLFFLTQSVIPPMRYHLFYTLYQRPNPCNSNPWDAFSNITCTFCLSSHWYLAISEVYKQEYMTRDSNQLSGTAVGYHLVFNVVKAHGSPTLDDVVNWLP